MNKCRSSHATCSTGTSATCVTRQSSASRSMTLMMTLMVTVLMVVIDHAMHWASHPISQLMFMVSSFTKSGKRISRSALAAVIASYVNTLDQHCAWRQCGQCGLVFSVLQGVTRYIVYVRKQRLLVLPGSVALHATCM